MPMCTLSGVRQAGKTATGMSSIVRAAWKEYHNACVPAKKPKSILNKPGVPRGRPE